MDNVRLVGSLCLFRIQLHSKGMAAWLSIASEVKKIALKKNLKLDTDIHEKNSIYLNVPF